MLKKKDFEILKMIRANARITLVEMARKLSLPVSTVFNRLNFIEKNFVKKYTSILDFEKLNYSIFVSFFIKQKDKQSTALMDFLSVSENVNTLLRVNNGYDIYVETIFKDIKQFHEFSQKMEDLDIEKKKEFHVIDALKVEEFMAKAKN